jgi:hypothetical protein
MSPIDFTSPNALSKALGYAVVEQHQKAAAEIKFVQRSGRDRRENGDGQGDRRKEHRRARVLGPFEALGNILKAVWWTGTRTCAVVGFFVLAKWMWEWVTG